MANVAAVKRTKTKTVMITGASGFLGQHLVKLAHTRNDQNITKLVLFDKVPFTKKLDYKESIPQTTVIGDVTDIGDIGRAMTSVDYVIHCCSHVDIRMFPDPDLLDETNVLGTKNVISCCVREGVKGLVYTSSVIAVADDVGIDMADESYSYPEESALSSAYAATKQRAEKLVLTANATPHASGSGSLRTTVLRPPGIYGEGDWVFITQLLKTSTGGWCFMPLFAGDDPPTQQMVYAGNAAWAHLCAIKTLEENPRAVSGEVFHLTDDTPAGSYDALCRPIVYGLGHAYCQVPHRPVVYVLYFTQLLLSIIRIFVGVNVLLSPRIFEFMGTKVTFSGRKLRSTCAFEPIFTYQESFDNSMQFYRTLVEKDPAKSMFGDWSISKIMSWIQVGVLAFFIEILIKRVDNISKKWH